MFVIKEVFSQPVQGQLSPRKIAPEENCPPDNYPQIIASG